jgi:hypothetical protein
MGWYEEELHGQTQLLDIGPQYAEAFTKLSGLEWVMIDPRQSDDEENRIVRTSVALKDTVTNASVMLTIDRHNKKVICTPATPPLPDGETAHGAITSFRDFDIRDAMGHRVDRPEAGVSLDRFLTNVPACAKRFYSMVVAPYLNVYPQVLAKIAEREIGYARRTEVVSDICRAYHGTAVTRGDRTYIVFRESSLPSLYVMFGGRFEFDRAPTVSRRVLDVMFKTMLEEKDSK